MKNLGMTKRLDELGRIVLPLEARRSLGLAEGDALDIFLDGAGEALSLKKHAPACLCCAGTEDLKRLPNGTYLCAACLEKAEQANKAPGGMLPPGALWLFAISRRSAAVP